MNHSVTEPYCFVTSICFSYTIYIIIFYVYHLMELCANNGKLVCIHRSPCKIRKKKKIGTNHTNQMRENSSCFIKFY